MTIDNINNVCMWRKALRPYRDLIAFAILEDALLSLLDGALLRLDMIQRAVKKGASGWTPLPIVSLSA